MCEKRKNIVVVVLMSGIILGMSLWCMGKPRSEFSASERRHLAQFPELTVDTLLNGDFMMEFEQYAADQFPLRENFRMLNSVFCLYGLQKKEVNDIYIADGYASKLSYEINPKAVVRWLSRFSYINERYLENKQVYFAVIPDKNYYLAGKGYPALNYDEFIKEYREGTKEFARFIDIKDILSVSNFYATDLHWKQETLPKVAEEIAGEMGVKISQDYDVKELDYPFYGVYSGQVALPLKPDKIQYLTTPVTEDFIVTCYDTGKAEEMPVYDMEKAYGRDSYEIYLSGSKSLITIENPRADSDRELVLFRDSFGSSLAPLLASGYRKITLVDIRYISPEVLGKFVEFREADVLFLYSVDVLNNTN